MIEVIWGKPLHLIVTAQGDKTKISTIEQARHLLDRKWPIRDDAQLRAIDRIDAAMHCLDSVETARSAFAAAAATAGYHIQIDRQQR